MKYEKARVISLEKLIGGFQIKFLHYEPVTHFVLFFSQVMLMQTNSYVYSIRTYRYRNSVFPKGVDKRKKIIVDFTKKK